MELKLTVDYKEEPGIGFIGWCNEIKGIVAQGKTMEDVKEDLIELIIIKFEIAKREMPIHESSKNMETEDLACLQPA